MRYHILENNYTFNEIIEYFETHSEKETLEYFKVSKSAFYRYLKKYNYKKPKELIIKRRQDTISKIPDYWEQRNIKFRKTCIKKFGVDHNFKISEVKLKNSNRNKSNVKERFIKTKITNLKNYGVENPFQAEECKNKAKQTKKECYGDENYNNREKASNTFISNINKNKYKFRKYCYNNTYLDSLPELAFYMFYIIETNIPIKRCDRSLITFEYYIDNKKHNYIPDFVLNNNTIIEIKSLYYLNKVKELNPDKYECMIKNGVKIITDQEYKQYIIWFKNNFNIEDFKARR